MPTPKPPAPGNPFARPVSSTAKLVGEQELPDPMQKVLQQERERIARVLHDTICQDLTGLHYLAGGLAIKYQANSPEVAEKLVVLADKIRRAGHQLGEFMNALRGSEPL